MDDLEQPVIVHDGLYLHHANPSAVQLFGYHNLSDMLTVSLLDLIDSISWPLARQVFNECLAEPEKRRNPLALIFQRLNGSRFLASIDTKSLGWMGDAIPKKCLFWSTIDCQSEMP